MRHHRYGRPKETWLWTGETSMPGSYTRPAAAAVALTATSIILITSLRLQLQPFTCRDIIHYLQQPAQTVQAIQRLNLLTGGGLAVGGEGAIDGSQLRGAAWWNVGWILSSCRLLDRRRLLSGCRRGRAGQLLACFITSTDVMAKPECVVGWTRLLGFTSGCLGMPDRGGKNRNLTAAVLRQISSYAAGEGRGMSFRFGGKGGEGGKRVRR